jgi:hypothetical protein
MTLAGTDPLDWAIWLAREEITVLDEIRAARAEDPHTYPIYVWELSPEASARRIIGRLLDAGWTPPADREAAG